MSSPATKNSGQFQKGLTPWNKGKTGMMPTPWNKGLKGVLVAWNKGIKNPEMSGNKHPNWKGGATRKELECPSCDGYKSLPTCKQCKNCKDAKQRGENTYQYKGGKPKCIECGKVTTQYNTIRCHPCWLQSMVGEGSPNWKGGITPISSRIRNSLKMKQWTLSVFKRDNFTCQECKVRGGYLEAHHIKPFREILRDLKEETNGKDLYDYVMKNDKMWEISNGTTLCLKCHSTIDSYRNIFTNLISK